MADTDNGNELSMIVLEPYTVARNVDLPEGAEHHQVEEVFQYKGINGEKDPALDDMFQVLIEPLNEEIPIPRLNKDHHYRVSFERNGVKYQVEIKNNQALNVEAMYAHHGVTIVAAVGPNIKGYELLQVTNSSSEKFGETDENNFSYVLTGTESPAMRILNPNNETKGEPIYLEVDASSIDNQFDETIIAQLENSSHDGVKYQKLNEQTNKIERLVQIQLAYLTALENFEKETGVAPDKVAGGYAALQNIAAGKRDLNDVLSKYQGPP